MQREHEINVLCEPASRSFLCKEDQNVLAAMQQAGLAVVPVGCRGGGCGVCKVEILEGESFYGKMSRAHVSQDDEEAGNIGLACKLFPRTNLKVRPIGPLFKKINKNAQSRAQN